MPHHERRDVEAVVGVQVGRKTASIAAGSASASSEPNAPLPRSSSSRKPSCSSR